MLKHVREKHPEARIPIQNGQNGGEKTIEVQEVDVKNDPGRPQPMQIEYKDIHTSASDHQVRVWAFVKMSSQQEFYATVETKKLHCHGFNTSDISHYLTYDAWKSSIILIRIMII